MKRHTAFHRRNVARDLCRVICAAVGRSARGNDGYWHSGSAIRRKGLQAASVFTVCGSQFSHSPFVRRHATAYVVLYGRRCLRRATQSKGSVSLCEGRGVSRRRGRPTGETLAADSTSWWLTDHSDGFGFFPLLFSGDAKLLAYPQGRRWYDMIQTGKGANAAIEMIVSFSAGEMAEGRPYSRNVRLSLCLA